MLVCDKAESYGSTKSPYSSHFCSAVPDVLRLIYSEIRFAFGWLIHMRLQRWVYSLHLWDDAKIYLFFILHLILLLSHDIYWVLIIACAWTASCFACLWIQQRQVAQKLAQASRTYLDFSDSVVQRLNNKQFKVMRHINDEISKIIIQNWPN